VLTYLLILAGGILFLVILLNTLRKWHWDTVHQNLLDLVDEIGGQVIRRSFFSRPIYHGNYKDVELAINFSSERNKKGRSNLIDVSIAKELSGSLTIAAYAWLEQRDEKSIEEYKSLLLTYGNRVYGLRTGPNPPDNALMLNEGSIRCIEKLHPFRFIFIGRQGVLFEKESNGLPQDTRHPLLKEKLNIIFELIDNLEK
jgi:hypothetical protein